MPSIADLQSDVNLCTIHAKCMTIMTKDWNLLKALRYNMVGEEVPGMVGNKTNSARTR